MCKLKKKIIIMFYDLDRNAGIQSVIHYWVSVLNSEYDVEILLAKDPVCERLHNVTYKRITLFDHSDQHTFFRSIDYILSFVFMRKNKNARYIDFGTYCWIFFPFIYAFRHFGVTYNARNALILRLARLISKNARLYVSLMRRHQR